MNKLTLSLLSAALVVGASAQAPAKVGTPKSIACAVMSNNKVDVAKATKNHMYADYKGNRYFFCCAGCPSAFKQDPAKFAKAAHIPVPKNAK